EGRARQAEAKAALSAMFAAEQGFYAEHGSYTECLTNGGYSVTPARNYYLTGLWAGDLWTCGDGTQSCYASSWDPVVFCDCTCGMYDGTGINNATWSNTVVADPSLQILNSCSIGNAAGVPFAWRVSAQAFTVGAYGSIVNNGKWDAWQIDQDRVITHV